MKYLLIASFSFITLLFSLGSIVFAASNIDASFPNYYAWNDKIGWLDFRNANISSGFLDGYADLVTPSGVYGSISLNCLTGPSGTSCAPINYSVKNDGGGNLSGWAWSDSIGWVSFDCHNPETGGSSPDYSCVTSPYQVKINSSTRELTGYAWNDVVGWISFNCNQPNPPSNTCATVDYRVKTTWASGPASASLMSGTFDTGQTGGAAYNYLVWRGALNGGSVTFQFATSNCANGATDAPACVTNVGWGGSKTSGDGAFLGPGGTTNAADVYASAGTDIPVRLLNQTTHNNKRYFRYMVYLQTDAVRSATPIIQDVIVNWSR